MFDFSQLVILSLIFSLIALLSISTTFFYLKYRKANNEITSYAIKMLALEQTIDRMVEEIDLLSMKESDGFVKFLSDSREWAFNYIEEVQSAIESLEVAMESEDNQKIRDAYTELLKHLPGQENND